ncbi:MAG: hypothetical protein JWP97_2549 [Labilithrix sp.]|nr:hypothetical protein [Labilithrix sp.]
MRAAALLVALALAAAGCDKKEAPPPAPVASASAPLEVPSAAPLGSGRPHAEKVEFPEVPIRAGATTTVHVAWRTPEGTAVNEDAPFRVRWNRSDALAEAPSDVRSTGNAAPKGFDIAVKPLAGAPNATLGGVIDLVVCDAVNHSVCKPVKRVLDIEFVVGRSAGAETTVTVPLPQARAGS